ncbi:LANO_0F13674g1_1 [Lachancea nothofagi CBS 11611]|uniref:LANO_0F13674g1_1 n=1 Tax=Lachancea nothofagi CBS 11611 TaxID=1266666 RepID=A0A1G4KC08_9SACH|nr:LANO_0F13674g1_1 [Lachancea nothofagi CBS 11611]
MPSSAAGESSSLEHSPLHKWNSCSSFLDPPRDMPRCQVRKIHIYDFDNTLFKSPAPNPNLLSSFLINLLTDPQRLSNGGWWSEPRFLKELIDEWIGSREEKSSRSELDTVDGLYWNQDVVELSRLSQQDPHTLSIMMTGRKEAFFQDAVSEVLRQPVFGKHRLHFNAVFLKKDGFQTTMLYKTTCLTDLLTHYDKCEEITIYDDRVRQLHGFQQFLNEFVEAMRPSLQFSLIHVPGLIKYLKPAKERSIISHVFKEHNDAVSNVVFQPNSRAYGFYMGKMYVKEKRLGAAYIVTASSRLKIAKFAAVRFGNLINSGHYHIVAKSVLCTPYGAITTRKVATMVLSGSCKEASEQIVESYMRSMNSGVENSRIRFRITRFGVAAAMGRIVCDLEPEDDTRYAYTEFPALRLLLATTDIHLIEHSSNLYRDELYEWTQAKDCAEIVDTDFGYMFIITAIMAKKPKKSKKRALELH